MNWKDKQRVRVMQTHAEIESVDGNSPDVENSPSSPREMNSDNCSSGRGRVRGRGRGRGHGRGCSSRSRRQGGKKTT